MFPAFLPSTPLRSTRHIPPKALSPRRPSPKSLLPPDHVEYSREEGLDDPDSAAFMPIWNSVIHASLKRKLQGLVPDTPVASGVSALLHSAPGYRALETSHSTANPIDLETEKRVKQPEEIVTELLQSFKADALEGAECFIRVASETNHVKRAKKEALVLFVGDNRSYRCFLHVLRFVVRKPRWERGGGKCVVGAMVWGGGGECAVFDFQMELEEGGWKIEEVFRI